MKRKLLIGLGLLAFSFATAHAAEALDEKQFHKLMKQVSKVSKDFKTNFEGKNSAALEKDAATAAAAYKQMAGFWKTRKADDAAKWSEDSATAATATATAAKAGNWDGVKTHWNAVSKSCKGCHDAHREKLPDGGYKIK
ncbi:MAG TPA: cytochrome c [Verrucomicrobiae bacterium]|jgi:cytochrome c556